MDRDHVRPCEQVIEADGLFDARGQLPGTLHGDLRVVAQHAHAERVRRVRDLDADRAQADHSAGASGASGALGAASGSGVVGVGSAACGGASATGVATGGASAGAASGRDSGSEIGVGAAASGSAIGWIVASGGGIDGGALGALTGIVTGGSSNTEYSRRKRPFDQFTSTRKVRFGSRIAWFDCTRITGSPRAFLPTSNSSGTPRS